MSYYSRTFVGLGIVFIAVAAGALLANRFAGVASARHAELEQEISAARGRRAIERDRVARLDHVMGPVREFALAWQSPARVNEKDGAEKIRSEIEAIAQRQLGLVTDNAITPQPERYLFQGLPLRVQRVTLRASGKDLTALLAWLGKVEEKYPAAVVEHCEFSSNVGGNTGLTLRLVQPVQDRTPTRAMAGGTVIQEAAALPDAIAASVWLHYLPALVKGAVAVGVPRNPLQPAITGDSRPVTFGRNESDEITPRLETALEGHVRSVVRGASPLVVVDGRIFRVGDEVVLGQSRQKPVPESRTKLKNIEDDRLIFRVSGGTIENPIQCDVAYPLPSFLQTR